MASPTIRFGYFTGAGLSFFRHTDRKICVLLPSVGVWVSRPDAVIAHDLIEDGQFFDCERPHHQVSGR